MSGAVPDPSTVERDQLGRLAGPGRSTEPTEPGRSTESTEAGRPGEGPAEAAPAPSAAPQPLASLSSLLGGSFEGGQVCDADGNCG